MGQLDSARILEIMGTKDRTMTRELLVYYLKFWEIYLVIQTVEGTLCFMIIQSDLVFD